MSATRGSWERRVEKRIERAVLSGVVLAFMARRSLVLSRGWLTDRLGRNA